MGGGLAWWGRGLKLEGQGGEEGRDSVCLYIIYRDIELYMPAWHPRAHPLSPFSTAHPPRGVYL